MKFLDGLGLDRCLRQNVLFAIRDLWAHGSTAIEGNRLTLGETRLVIEEGLTIAGKPLRDHVEVVGHARAMDLMVAMLGRTINPDDLFALHKAVLNEVVIDFHKPQGAWKNEPNGTYVDRASLGLADSGPAFLYYAEPRHVPALMAEFLRDLNRACSQTLGLDQAPAAYARLHLGFVNVHPFFDGNGRMARLLANLPLLNAGLPPLLFAAADRRTHLQAAMRYTHRVGQVDIDTGVWPQQADSAEFETVCRQAYRHVRAIIDNVLCCQAEADAKRQRP